MGIIFSGLNGEDVFWNILQKTIAKYKLERIYFASYYIIFQVCMTIVETKQKLN